MDGISFSHVGICVADLERSERFYIDGLGFTAVDAARVGKEFEALTEVDGQDLESRMLQRDGVTIELLYFRRPGHLGQPHRRPVNQLGLTHLSLRVDSVDRVAAIIRRYGGEVLPATRTATPGAGGATLDFVYCTDPDGTRIELMRLP